MISTKGRYALKVMVELAEHDAEEYIPLKGIAEKLNISQKYLESISTILSKGHMIEGVSGKKGGYRLKRKPEEYRVGDILRLTEPMNRQPSRNRGMFSRITTVPMGAQGRAEWMI